MPNTPKPKVKDQVEPESGSNGQSPMPNEPETNKPISRGGNPIPPGGKSQMPNEPKTNKPKSATNKKKHI